MTPADQAARREALNVRESFCISAPAGSGKTSLLVQRMLALLARVEHPESVVAVTFTRKAAAEMRARIVSALRGASEGRSSGNSYADSYLQLAQAVLERDAAAGWGLLQNPARLRIQTIDSFCGSLVRQMPILSGCGGQLAPSEQSEPLYREAIESFLRRELQTADARRRSDVSAVLMHLDNQWELLAQLLTSLLRRREQWQPVFGAGGLKESHRDDLRSLTTELIDFRLRQLRMYLDPWLAELGAVMALRHENLPEEPAFDPDSTDLNVWQSVGRFLLTGSGSWRKTLSKRDGFPAGKGAPAEQKARALDLLEALRDGGDIVLLHTLRQLACLPDTHASAAHWEVLAALTRLLPRLAAELLLVFRRRGEVDHAQIAMAALSALGDDAAPTDLALRLDYRIEHLLVDEFQDTSSLQFELIRRLTRGWPEHNAAFPEAPRTLLLVGDAMQSIYGFREANVGLFIKARDEGIGSLRLRPLELSVNFRSQAEIVGWVNDVFESAFPGMDDAQSGAVRFRRADATRDPDDLPELRVFTGEGAREAEVAALCDKLESGLADDTVGSIAILGRSRNHLRPVLAELRERGIDVAARDLDPLATRPLIRDLVTLCCVLCDRFDAFAWLCLLRSPPIALDNQDLLHIALELPTAAALGRLSDADIQAIDAISPIGRERIEHLARLLRWADRYRERLAQRVWIEECWLRLGGAAALRNAADEKDAEQFLQCIEALEAEQRPLNRYTLETAVADLFASAADERCKVQVMTLHKAKGLEFDWVFIPALGAGTRSGNQELLLWDEFALPGSDSGFLLDVRSSVDGATDGQLYDYLKTQLQQKQRYEATRLLYVGCTRASEYLWLSACLSVDDRNDSLRAPGAASLLGPLWDAVQERASITAVDALGNSHDASEYAYRRLLRVPQVEPAAMLLEPSAAAVLHDPSRHPRAFGTALHRCLESLIYREVMPDSCDDTLRALFTASLRELGTPSHLLRAQLEEGTAALNRVLADDWAQWMLSPARGARYAEYCLTAVTGAAVEQLVLDYVFLDEARGEYWVVDYKTAAPADDETVPTFMQRQLDYYREQLARYRGAAELRFDGSIRCALYFTTLGRHCEWRETAIAE